MNLFIKILWRKPSRHISSGLLTCLLLLPMNIYSQNQWRVFTTQNSGLPDNSIRAIAIDTNNNKWIGTINGLAKYDGNTWTVFDTSNSPMPFASVFTIAIDKNNYIWLGSWSGGGLVKFDGINNWIIYNTTNSGMPSNQLFSIVVDFNNIKWIASGRGLAKFNDTNWVIYNTTNSGLQSNSLNNLLLESNIKWVGTYNMGLAKYDNSSWVIYNYNNSGLPSDWIEGLSIDLYSNLWIATVFGGLAKFNSSQNQWTVYNVLNSGLPENNLEDVIVDRNNTKWIGTYSSGLVRYNDTIWNIYNTTNSPLLDNTPRCFAIDSFNNKWIGTGYGLAIFNEYGILPIKENKQEIPVKFILHQNYPDPFNITTNIKYELKVKSNIKLILFDITGKMVSILKEDTETAGTYNLKFNVRNLSSGIYFYMLKTENYSFCKKMILLK